MKFKSQRPGTVLSQVVHWYLLFLCDSSIVRQPLLRLFLALWLVAYHSTSLWITVCLFSGSPIFSAIDLVNKIHGIVWFFVQVTYFVMWRNRALLRYVLHDVTELMLRVEMPVEAQIRRKVTARFEAKHKLILWIHIAMGILILLLYLLPPIVFYLVDLSSDKLLKLPLGMCDPFSNVGDGGGTLTRGLLHLLATFFFCNLNFVTIINILLLALLLDGLKTLFRLSGLSFVCVGSSTFCHQNDVRAAVEFHQRVCRLSFKMKTLLEPVLALNIFNIGIYQLMCALGAYQLPSSRATVLLGAAVIIMIPMFLAFWLPASTTHMAEEITSCVYLNGNWVARKFKAAEFFPLVIMRANRREKFRVFNCWVLSMENFIQYLKTLYSFFVVITSLISRPQKESVMSS